jgi:hypothetical protein
VPTGLRRRRVKTPVELGNGIVDAFTQVEIEGTYIAFGLGTVAIIMVWHFFLTPILCRFMSLIRAPW